jgi:hypothetical protein
LSEGVEAAEGEDGRPRSPAGPTAVPASAPPPSLHQRPQGRDDVPLNPARELTADELSDDRPTMPPAPGKREAALRWAMPEPAPAEGGLSFSPPVGRSTLSEGHRPPPHAGPTTSPSGSALLPARGGDPTGPMARTSVQSPSPALVTQPVPVAHPQPMPAEVGSDAIRPPDVVTAPGVVTAPDVVTAPGGVTAPADASQRRRSVFWLLAARLAAAWAKMGPAGRPRP